MPAGASRIDWPRHRFEEGVATLPCSTIAAIVAEGNARCECVEISRCGLESRKVSLNLRVLLAV